MSKPVRLWSYWIGNYGPHFVIQVVSFKTQLDGCCRARQVWPEPYVGYEQLYNTHLIPEYYTWIRKEQIELAIFDKLTGE